MNNLFNTVSPLALWVGMALYTRKYLLPPVVKTDSGFFYYDESGTITTEMWEMLK